MVDRNTSEGVGLDDTSRGLVVISTEHERIHDGVMYEAGFLWSEVTAIADDASAEFLLQLTDGAHAIFNIAAGGDAEVHFFENPTFSAAGDLVTVFNKNRFSSNTSSAVATANPTITDAGTALPKSFLPGGSGPHSGGGSDGNYNHERVLKGGNDYLVRVTNRAGATKAISIGVEFYEPES